MGRKAVAVKGDVGQEEDAKRIVETCVQNFGSIHILVNNAGISKPAMLYKLTVDVGRGCKCSDERPLAYDQSGIQVFYGAEIRKNCERYFCGRYGGNDRPDQLCSCKGRCCNLNQICSRELAKFNVTANVISLGIVTTEMTMTLQTDEKLKEIYVRRILLNRYAEPECCAGICVFCFR